jgi:transcription initiation factor IIE alpha subunit
MIWGGDHDMEDSESFEMVSNFSCPECESQAEFYTNKKCMVEVQPVTFIKE